jgi:uncharacterized protein
MIDLDARYIQQIKQIIRALTGACEVRVFGSRIDGTAKKYSDLDLALVSEKEIPSEQMEAMRDAFSGSSIPIMVDIVDYKTVSERFKNIIDARYELL